MIRLLITGASGFLGRHILKSALSTARYEIHAVSRTCPAQTVEGVTWHEADLTRQGVGCELIERVAPDYVIHAAWIATPGEYLASPANLSWLRVSLEMAHAFGRLGGEKWLGVGSCLEYGTTALPCAEDTTPTAPGSVYGRCKLSSCHALIAAAGVYGFSATWARVFVPYGSGDQPGRLIPSLIDALSAGREFPTTAGGQVRDFIDAEDVGRMIVTLMETPSSGVFNVGTGHGVTVRSVVELVADYLGRRDLVRFGERKIAPGEPPYLVADMRKTIMSLGDFKFARPEDKLMQLIEERHAR